MGNDNVTRGLSGISGSKGASISSIIEGSHNRSTARLVIPEGVVLTSWALISTKNVSPTVIVLSAIGPPGRPLSSSYRFSWTCTLDSDWRDDVIAKSSKVLSAEFSGICKPNSALSGPRSLKLTAPSPSISAVGSKSVWDRDLPKLAFRMPSSPKFTTPS